MLRFFGLAGMASLFLLISPQFRETVLNGLGTAVLALGQYSPYSYIALALFVGGAAVWSMAAPKPQ